TDPHQPRGALVEAVYHSELEGRKAKPEDQVQRKDGRDHLAREVGEKAHEAEKQAIAAASGPAPAVPQQPGAPEQLSCALCLIHGRTRRGATKAGATAVTVTIGS